MLLFINSCVRRECSRTLRICLRFLERYWETNPGEAIVRLDISAAGLRPLDEKELSERDALIQKGKLRDGAFSMARQFAAAEKILVGAPYWDLSFPAALKTYIEHISVNNIAFRYSESGQEGICKAEKMLFITTAGGYIGDRDFGGDYLRGVCGLFGIPRFDSIKAEGLDILGTDVEGILQKAFAGAERLAEKW